MWRVQMKHSAVVLAFLATVLLLPSGCARYSQAANFREAVRIAGGDPYAGREAIQHYGCRTCHTIPGIPGANGQVGPPLTQFATRAFIAGELPNNPENLMQWLRSPHAVEPKTAMPEM